MLARIKCAWRGIHDPQRHPLGGFTCRECGEPGADLADMGTMEHGYVPAVRRLYDRKHGTLTRTEAWSETRRGGLVVSESRRSSSTSAFGCLGPIVAGLLSLKAWGLTWWLPVHVIGSWIYVAYWVVFYSGWIG